MNQNFKNRVIRRLAAAETRAHQRQVRRGFLAIVGRNRGERRRRQMAGRALMTRRAGAGTGAA